MIIVKIPNGLKPTYCAESLDIKVLHLQKLCPTNDAVRLNIACLVSRHISLGIMTIIVRYPSTNAMWKCVNLLGLHLLVETYSLWQINFYSASIGGKFLYRSATMRSRKKFKANFIIDAHCTNELIIKYLLYLILEQLNIFGIV